VSARLADSTPLAVLGFVKDSSLKKVLCVGNSRFLLLTVVDLPTYDMVWGMVFRKRFNPTFQHHQRTMFIDHRGQGHTFTARNSESRIAAPSPVFALCSYNVLARLMHDVSSTLDWDGAVLGCLTTDLCSVDAGEVSSNHLDDPVLAGKEGTEVSVASILAEFQHVLRTEIPGGLPQERLRADGTKIEDTIEALEDVTWYYSRPPRPFTSEECADIRRYPQDLLERG
jgi:hypothetical protein